MYINNRTGDILVKADEVFVEPFLLPLSEQISSQRCPGYSVELYLIFNKLSFVG